MHAIYWHISLFPCKKPVRVEMCICVSVAVTALESAFLYLPSPQGHCWIESSILKKPHHVLPNEYEIVKACRGRNNIQCHQLLNLVISYISIYFPIPAWINPAYPLRPNSNIFFYDAYLNFSKIIEKLIANLGNAVGMASKHKKKSPNLVFLIFSV